MQLGQLSSAILEYETVLQRFPGDPDVQAALKEIETKANNFTAQPTLTDISITRSGSEQTSRFKKTAGGKVVPADIDDGRRTMQKIFVDSKIITTGDFDLCWTTPDLSVSPKAVSDPFVQNLANKGVVGIEKSLKVLVERSRHAYLPLDKYDVDLELARKFPADACRRWCVFPFDKMSKTIFVATANPFNVQAAKELGEATQSRLLWYLSPPSEIVSNLRKAFR